MNNLMKAFSFTKNETKVILFVIAVLTAGFSIKYYKYLTKDSAPYDFTMSDSEFKRKSANAEKNLKQTDTLTGKEEELSDMLLVSEDSLKTKSNTLKPEDSDEFSGEIININTANKPDLVDLPGIGESIADRIIAYRETKKGFKKTEELMKVKGIGKKKFDKIKNHIKAE